MSSTLASTLALYTVHKRDARSFIKQARANRRKANEILTSLYMSRKRVFENQCKYLITRPIYPSHEQMASSQTPVLIYGMDRETRSKLLEIVQPAEPSQSFGVICKWGELWPHANFIDSTSMVYRYLIGNTILKFKTIGAHFVEFTVDCKIYKAFKIDVTRLR